MDEAAATLGITVNAVRQRIKRGTITGEKRGGVWYVSLSTVDSGRTDRPTDRPRPTTATTPPPARDDALIEQLQQENDWLRDQLDTALRTAERERERADVIAQLALQRIEALATTTPDARGSSESDDTPDSGSGHPHAATGRPASFLQRLRRLFSHHPGTE